MSRRVETRQSARIVRDQLAREKRRQRARWITVGAVALLVVAALTGWAVYAANRPAVRAVPANTTNDGGSNAGLNVAGDGPVTVEVYLDFLCPNCRAFEAATTPTLNQLVADHKIKLVWHTLNFLDPSTSTAYSTRAANAAGCASDAGGGKLQPFGEALFAQQPAEGSAGLTDDQIIDIGGVVGLNAPAFSQCVRNQPYKGWVNQVTTAAVQRGVTGTPTVHVDGRVVASTPQAVTAAVDAAS